MKTTGLFSPSLSQVIADRTPSGGGGRAAVPTPSGETGQQPTARQEGNEGQSTDPRRMAEAQEAVNQVLEHLNVKHKLAVDRDLERVVARAVGVPRRVLVEASEREGSGWLRGRGGDYLPVRVPAAWGGVGEFVTVTPTASDGEALVVEA